MQERLSWPRSVWVMVPAGDPTEETITRLAEMLEADGIIIDGGNSNLKNSVPRAKGMHVAGRA